MSQDGIRPGVLVASLLFMLVIGQSLAAEEAPLTLQQKAEVLLKLPTPASSQVLVFPSDDNYQSTWLRHEIGRKLRDELNYGYSREQILRVKKFLCVDTEGTPGLRLYEAIAKWQVENEYVEDAQQTLRDAVAFSRRLKSNPPPLPRINGWCGCVEIISPESRIVCAMLRVGSSDEDVLAAAAEITPDWESLQYFEEPYLRLTAKLGRHDLALELVRRLPVSMMAAIDSERVAEEILHDGDHALAKLAFEQTLAMIPDPKQENWDRGDYSFPVRAAACLGHMGEYELAAKFLERSEEFPELWGTSLWVKELAQQYLDQAALGKSTLPMISKDDPDYQRKVEALGHQCDELAGQELPELIIDVIGKIPPNDPARFEALLIYLAYLAGTSEDPPQPASSRGKDLLRKHMELFPKDIPENEEEAKRWRYLDRRMAQYLIRFDMLDEYPNRYDPKTLAAIFRDLDYDNRIDYPAFGVDESLRYFQSIEPYDFLVPKVKIEKLRKWLAYAKNQADAQRMAAMLVESDDSVRDPDVFFLTGEYHLCRELHKVAMDSADYSVAGEKTEKDWYPLTDLMIDTYLRGEDNLAKLIAVKIIDRLWLIRDRKLENKDATRRHNEVVAALLILEKRGS